MDAFSSEEEMVEVEIDENGNIMLDEDDIEYFRNPFRGIKRGLKKAGRTVRKSLPLTHIRDLVRGKKTSRRDPSPLKAGRKQVAIIRQPSIKEPVAQGKYGWVGKVLQKCVDTDRVFAAMSNVRVTSPDGPLRLNYDDIDNLVGACKNVTQGSSTKEFATDLAPATPASINVDLLTNQACGYVIRISDPENYAQNGVIQLSLTFDYGGSNARTYNIVVAGNDNVYEFFVLAFTSNGGNGEVAISNALRLTIDTSTNPVNAPTANIPATAFAIESVNEYDFNAKS